MKRHKTGDERFSQHVRSWEQVVREYFRRTGRRISVKNAAAAHYIGIRKLRKALQEMTFED